MRKDRGEGCRSHGGGDKHSRLRGISHLSVSPIALKSILTSTIRKNSTGFHNQSTSFKDKREKDKSSMKVRRGCSILWGFGGRTIKAINKPQPLAAR